MTPECVRVDEATLADCAAEPISVPGAVQPHAAVVVFDGPLRPDSRVVCATANAAALLAAAPDGLTRGSTLTDLVGPVAATELAALDVRDGPRGQYRRMTLAGAEVDVSHTSDGGVSVLEIEAVAGSQEVTATFEDAVTAAITRMHDTADPGQVVERVCDLVAELTGFDRVMGYRFEPDDHGVVVAEHAGPGLTPFLGLHYPASDIPAQARELYLRQWIRLIPDARYTPVPLVPATLPDGRPLDMSRVGARAVSPVHVEYLANMGVRASMSISLIVDGRLWGLVACHHYAGPRRPSVPVRLACEFVALAASVIIGSRLSERRSAEALVVERRLNRLAELLLAEDDLATGLTADADLLTGLLDADGAAVVLGGRTRVVGCAPDPADIAALVERLAADQPGEVVATDRIAERFPDRAGSGRTAGLVALPLSSVQRNYLLWFRDRWEHEVRWGGEPTKAVHRSADGPRLAPRASFAEWVESVRDRSRPWSVHSLGAVEQLRGLLARHISRTAEHLARLNAELVRSNAELDAFAYVAAHDLKEPLRGLANYASFLAEDYRDVLGSEGMHQLDMMVSLTGRMNGLLGSLLNYSRVGRGEPRREPMRLSTLLAEVTEFLTDRLAGSNVELVLASDTELVADGDLMGQVLMNLLSNAIKYTTSARPRIEVGATPVSATPRGVGALPRSPLADTDPVAVYVRDNGIGIPTDRHEDIFRVFRRLHGPDEYGGGEGAGLTIARRIVERHGGTMWVESAPGEGATFYFTLGAS